MTEPKSERFIFSASKAFFEQVDDWRRAQQDIPSRAEAVRRLVQLGLGAEPVLQVLLRLIESLPPDPELGKHAEEVRALVEF